MIYGLPPAGSSSQFLWEDRDTAQIPTRIAATTIRMTSTLCPSGPSLSGSGSLMLNPYPINRLEAKC